MKIYLYIKHLYNELCIIYIQYIAIFSMENLFKYVKYFLQWVNRAFKSE